MKVGFIGLGRMGHGMASRILQSGHDLAIYDLVPALLEDLGAKGATVAGSLAEAVAGRDVVISMLPHDEALEALVFSPGGLLECLPGGAIHMVSGTHGVEIVRRLTAAHADAGQVLVAGHVLGRPDLAAEGKLTMIPGGPPEALRCLQPIFDVLGARTFVTGDEPQTSTAVKIANNFVLGSVIEIIGESMSLVRKYGVDPALFQQVMTEGLFGAPAFRVYGQIIVDEAYDKVGASVQIGLKDANLALAAGEVVDVPLPSANVWRDRLLSARAHGDGDLDWAVMAREQARASGIENKPKVKVSADERIYAIPPNSPAPRAGSLLAEIQKVIRDNGKASKARISKSVQASDYRGARSGKPATAKNVTDALWQGVRQGMLKVAEDPARV